MNFNDLKLKFMNKTLFQIPGDIYKCWIAKSILVSKKGPFIVFSLIIPSMFRYKTLRHEILLFGFFQNFYLFLSLLVRFINFSVPKWGYLMFFFLKCFDLLNFSNFEIKLMNQKRISNPWWYLRMFNWKVNFSVQKGAIYGFFLNYSP